MCVCVCVCVCVILSLFLKYIAGITIFILSVCSLTVALLVYEFLFSVFLVLCNVVVFTLEFKALRYRCFYPTRLLPK